jgi:uncharacterized protein YqeY
VNEGLKSRLRQDLNAARKAKDKLKTLVLSTTLADLRNREIELGQEADDEEVQGVLTKAVKRRKEAADQMRSGGRSELAEKEEAEARILSDYLPEGLPEDEVRSMIREILEQGPRELGPVMGQLMPKIKGRFDGKEANRLVREELGE